MCACALTITGVIHLSLCMKAGGAIDDLRVCLQRVLVESVQVMNAPPRAESDSISRQFSCLLRSCLPATDAGRERFVLLKRLLSGDINSDNVVLRIPGGVRGEGE